eukprot:53306-Alexandrium_andersonii.AAC.1
MGSRTPSRHRPTALATPAGSAKQARAWCECAHGLCALTQAPTCDVRATVPSTGTGVARRHWGSARAVQHRGAAVFSRAGMLRRQRERGAAMTV